MGGMDGTLCYEQDFLDLFLIFCALQMLAFPRRRFGARDGHVAWFLMLSPRAVIF